MSNEIIIIILISVFLIFFIYVEPKFSKNKVINKDDHGSARFSNYTEINTIFEKEEISNIQNSGFPVYFNKRLKYVWFDKQTPHYVYIGSTGSGKSVTSVIPSCTFIANANVKRSVFITDPKGEIFETTSKMFESNGYKVLTIDFRNPELSNKLNLLEPIIKEFDRYIEYENKASKSTNPNEKIVFENKAIHSLAESNKLIKTVSTMIFAEKYESKDPFWNNASKSLLEGLIGFYLEEYKLGKISKEKITLTSIRKFQNSFMEESKFKKFSRYIEKKEYGMKSKDSLTSILTANENTYKSITAVFGEKLSLFDDLNVANIVSSSDFEFDILGKEPCALYVIVPDEDKVYFNLITMLVGIIYKELVKLANNSKNKTLPVGVDWILDEFANCPPLPDVQTIISVARSRNMKFYFFIQSFSQLNEVYGKDIAQIILDNCGLVYLKTNTLETAEIISKKLGKKTMETNSVSHSMSLFNYNGNSSVSLIGRELLTPEEVMKLHYKTIIFPIKGNPILRKTIMYNKFKIYKKGFVERKVNPLSNLKDTFFTVEDINLLSNRKNNNNKEEDLSSKDEFKEKEEYDKNILEEAIKIINDIFKETLMNYDYLKTDNYGLYLKVTLNKHISDKERSFLKARINDKKFHLEINKNNTMFSVYTKNLI